MASYEQLAAETKEIEGADEKSGGGYEILDENLISTALYDYPGTVHQENANNLEEAKQEEIVEANTQQASINSPKTKRQKKVVKEKSACCIAFMLMMTLLFGILFGFSLFMAFSPPEDFLVEFPYFTI